VPAGEIGSPYLCPSRRVPADIRARGRIAIPIHNIKPSFMHDVVYHIPIMLSDLVLISTFRHEGVSYDVVDDSRMMSKTCCKPVHYSGIEVPGS
jgi:hypothetical protein